MKPAIAFLIFFNLAACLGLKAQTSSLLASGEWYKIGFTETGVYRLDYNFIKSLGLDPSRIKKKNLRLYGKKGGIVPMLNKDKRDNDLQENAIFVSGNAEDNFSNGDFILFYGQSQTTWNYDSSAKSFRHRTNWYADTSYMFITTGSDKEGKRINLAPNVSGQGRNITQYDDYRVHDADKWTDVTRTVKSGRDWYGEAFDKVTSQTFSFDFQNLDQNQPVYIRGNVAARSLQASNFSLNYNGSTLTNLKMAGTTYDFLYPFAVPAENQVSFHATGDHIDIELVYNKVDNDALAWLDYIEMTARCNLRFNNGRVLNFRDTKSVEKGKVNTYHISNANDNLMVWDVTDFHNVAAIAKNINNGEFNFEMPGDTLHEFVAFDGTGLLNAINFGRVYNQDLHNISQPEFLIIAHPDFMPAALRLADFHRQHDGLKVAVITPQAIYNEFSSGAQDPGAIRDFCKMLYNRRYNQPGLDTFRYLLLFGGASYDPKYRVKNNTNFVVSYESANSLSFTNSYCTDDYYGLLDPNEGSMSENSLGSENLDIGIGRYPVSTITQAQQMVDKVLKYCEPKSQQDWRNTICFAADDEDGNTYFNFTEDYIRTIITPKYPVFNIDKIYLDAYKQESTPSGPRYPAAQDAINKRINSGCLVFTYSGHGGEAGLAHERVMEVENINSWNNTYRMPLFITATCELSRFDDPERVSAGVLCMLNAKGGAIGMFTTTRVVNAGGNDEILKGLYINNIFRRDNGKPRRMGDIYKVTKNSAGLGLNTMNFTFLGDPALRIALPEEEVVTTSINENPVKTGLFDTLSAMSMVTIKGKVMGRNGLKDSNFNGTLFPTVYDKERDLMTLGNDVPESTPAPFKMRENIIYKGKATISKGEFSFSFIVPRDVSYTNSVGRISYYAANGDIDASGYNQDIIISGQSKNPVKDDGNGPEIMLYINDTNFINGGLTNENPVLLAKLSDDIGINTVGNGVGHEITGVLNDGTPTIMNNFYQSEKDNFRKGTLTYPFASLNDGSYTLRLKVWDVENNSNEASINFVVVSSNKFVISKIFNYPNPFSESTTFSFEHNALDDNLLVELAIYDVRGNLVKTISKATGTDNSTTTQNGDPQDPTNGTRSRSMSWNGCDDGGGALAPGMYIYKLRATDSTGRTAEAASRLLIVR